MKTTDLSKLLDETERLVDPLARVLEPKSSAGRCCQRLSVDRDRGGDGEGGRVTSEDPSPTAERRRARSQASEVGSCLHAE
jgi:hypothetical protein